MKALRITALSITALSLLLLSGRIVWADEAAAPQAAVPQAGAAQAVAPAGASRSIEDLVRDRVTKKIPGKVSSVRKMPFGMFEVVIESEIVYVDENADYVITGHVFDTRTQEDLTSKRSEEVLRVDFSSLPLQLAFKIVRGDGSRPVAIFEDPNCPYCKR